MLHSTSEQPKKTRLKHTLGLGGAAQDRGVSFIAAAMLIHKNLPQAISSQHKNNLKNTIQELETLWSKNKENKTAQDLAALERLLIEAIRHEVYDNKISFKKVKDELDNAENHINWEMKRETKITLVENTTRTDSPITHFSEDLTKEWEKILTPAPPQWFKVLPQWEQQYFKNRLQQWKRESPEMNLGDFLGVVPTTIRRYPGSPNAYVTRVTIQDPENNKKLSFTKIRSGVVVPTKMKAHNKTAKAEKVEITKQNLEQLVAVAIQEKIKDTIQKRLQNPDFDPSKPLALPILFQTLYSPPFQPPGSYNNEAIEKAFYAVRKELKNDPQGFVNKHIPSHFFTELGLSQPLTFGKIDLLYSNKPVNNARGIAWLATLFGWQGSENRRTDKKLAKYATQYISENKGSEEAKMLQAALQSHEQMPYIQNTLFMNPPTRYNSLAEKAALEQNIAGIIGSREGSCVSGKDREEMITLIAIAQLAFYLKYGKFPPPGNASSKADKALREEFTMMIAHQYLSGHGHELAGENSKGCDGLKNVMDVLGKDVCHKIFALAPEYGINPYLFDPIKDVQKVAGLNKLSEKKLNVDTKVFLDKMQSQNAASPSSTFDKKQNIQSTDLQKKFTPSLHTQKQTKQEPKESIVKEKISSKKDKPVF